MSAPSDSDFYLFFFCGQQEKAETFAPNFIIPIAAVRTVHNNSYNSQMAILSRSSNVSNAL
jgi:hypothetical protein